MPLFILNIFGWIYAHKREVLICLGLLALILLVLFGANKCSRYFASKKIDNLKANVNAEVENLKGIQANIIADKVQEAVAIEKVKEATNQVLAATNATDAAKAETNRALNNLNSAVTNHHPVGITADELQRQLKELDGE